jgi:hypothetical protein
MIAECNPAYMLANNVVVVKVFYHVDGLNLKAQFKVELPARVFVKDLNETEKNIMHEVNVYTRANFPCIERICYKVNVWVEMPKPLERVPRERVNVRTG